MENQQTSTVELLELLASEVDLFVCFSFRWFVPVSCGGRTGCEFQSQGSQAESLECWHPTTGGLQHKLTTKLLPKLLSGRAWSTRAILWGPFCLLEAQGWTKHRTEDIC